MSTEIVGIKIQVNGQDKVLSSMGEVRKELKQAQFDVLKFSEQFGATSKEATEAAKRVAQLKDAVGDAKDLVAAFNPDAKFKALAGSVQGVAGGFAAVQGALGLVGAESENVQKTLLKVQSALALSEGLNSVMAAKDAFVNLGAVIKSGVTSAFGSLRSAIISTGIGALAIGVGLLIANFDKVKAAVLNLFPGLGKLSSFFGGLIQSVTDFVGVTSAAERALANLEKQTKRGNEGIEARIKILTAQGGKEKEIYELSKKQGENELNLLRAKLKDKKKLSDDELKQFRDLKVNQQVLDAQEKKRQDDDAKEAAKKGAEQGKAASDKQKQLNAEKLAAEKEARDRINQLIGESAVAGVQNEYEAKKLAIKNQLEREIKDVNDNEKIKAETKTALIVALTNKANAEVAAVNKDAAEKEKTEKEKNDKDAKDALLKQQEDDRKIRQIGLQDRIDIINKENAKIEMDFEQDLERLDEKRQILYEQELTELENTELTEAQKTEIKKKYADARAEVTNQEVATEKAAQQAKIDLNNRYLELAGQFGGVLQQIAGKNKALAIAGVVVEQAASIGRIISNTGVANAKAIAASPLTAGQPFVGINTVSAGLSIASSVAAGLKAVQQINQAQPGGGSGASAVSGGGASAPVAPTAPIQNTVTQLDQQSINQMGSATNRAYVVESDVTSKQERITRINRAARLS
jgi:hypothetical protein